MQVRPVTDDEIASAAIEKKHETVRRHLAVQEWDVPDYRNHRIAGKQC